MFDFINNITQWATSILSQGGYLGLFLLSIIDRVGVSIIPAEAILPFAGFLIGQGKFLFWPIMIVITIGGLIGDLILYWFSFSYGRMFLEKYGKYVLVYKHDLDHADNIFAKHGGKTVLISRFLPVIRSLISIPAGISKMNLGKFIIFTIVGSVPWNLGLIWVGVKSGENLQAVTSYLDRFSFVIIIMLAIVVAWYIFRHLRKKHATH